MTAPALPLNGRRTNLTHARDLFERAAEIGMDSPDPLTRADIAERDYIHHLCVEKLIGTCEALDRRVKELEAGRG